MAKYHCKKSHAMRILAFGPFRDELMFSFPSISLPKLAKTKSQLFFFSFWLNFTMLCSIRNEEIKENKNKFKINKLLLLETHFIYFKIFYIKI